MHMSCCIMIFQHRVHKASLLAAEPTCCKRDRAKGRPSPGYYPAWCYDKDSDPSAAPRLAAAECAVVEEAASQRAAGRLEDNRRTTLTRLST